MSEMQVIVMRQRMEIKILRCQRCGQDHGPIIFEPIRNQSTPDDATHWGICPEFNEPIMITVGACE